MRLSAGLTHSLLPLVALLWLGACSTLPPQTPPPQSTTLTQPTAQAFVLLGRIAAQDGERSANGRLEWQHNPDSDEWLLFNPLGQLAAQLSADMSGATLRTADGQIVQDRSVSQMLPELLGMSVPVEGLHYWVQAIPSPGARTLSVDESGRPTRISDSGWIIDYPQYAGPEADAHPRRIDATYGQARIRLIIDSWSVTP